MDIELLDVSVLFCSARRYAMQGRAAENDDLEIKGRDFRSLHVLGHWSHIISMGLDKL